MSENAQRVFVIIAACAMRDKVGLIRTVNYMRDNGFTTNEAIDVVAKFEDCQEQVKKGMLPD